MAVVKTHNTGEGIMAEGGAGIMGDSSLTVYEEVSCEGERVSLWKWGGRHPLRRETEQKGEGPMRKGEGVSWWWGFALVPHVGDNITNSLDSNISFLHMGRIWGTRTIKTVVVARLMSEHIRTYEKKKT